MTNARRRRQTRTRRTTGFPPELHNALDGQRRAHRRWLRSLEAAMRSYRRLLLTQREAHQILAALAEAGEVELEHHDERAAARDRTLNGPAKCTRCITANSDTPPHDPSPRCTAGSEPHCTCTTCL